MMKINSTGVILILINGDQLRGEVNIMDFKRFSDFIETHPAKHIKLFNVSKNNNYGDSIINFILIPKEKILYYQPVEDKEFE